MPKFGRTHRYPPGKAILPHPAPSRTLPVAQNDKHTVEIRGTTTAPGCSDKDKSTLEIKAHLQACSMILIKPAAQEGIPHCLSSKVPSPHSHFPLRPSRSVIPHLDVTASPRPGLLQDILLSSALASPPARKESLQKVPVCQGGIFLASWTPLGAAGEPKMPGVIRADLQACIPLWRRSLSWPKLFS